MLLDSPISDDGLIRIGGREYGTSEYIARTFDKCERTIRCGGLPRIPEWDRQANPGRAGATGLTPAGSAVLGVRQ